MYCPDCGTQLDASARYCSGCGRDLSAKPPAVGSPAKPPVVKERDWDLHVTLLAWLFIAQAALTTLIGIVVIFAGSVASRTLARAPGALPPDFPPEAAPWVGTLGVIIGFVLIGISLPSIAAGIGLLHYRSWGRILTILLSFLKILEVPLGTLTAIYAFWVLLSRAGSDFYKRKALEPEG